MMLHSVPLKRIQPVLAFAAKHPDEDLSLATLAAQTGLSVPVDTEVVPDTLPGGPVATTTHLGPYDKLSDAYAAIQQWIEAEGLVAAGSPWEAYVTDPGDYPDPADWKTEVFWPVAG